MTDEVRAAPVDGTCFLCGGTFARRGLTRHLATCRAKHPSAADVPAERILHLIVEGKYQPDYYLHIEVPATATFGELDSFLRAIWLECCGHLSGFRLAGSSGAAMPDFDLDAGEIEAMIRQAAAGLFATSPDDDNRLFGQQLGQRLQVGSTFEHDYDYGTTTELSLRVMADEQAVPRGAGVYLMARNNPPEIACAECGKPATEVCTECVWDGWGTLCDDCAAEHECGEEMLLPLVNSPRTGMCGYGGPATWENQPVGPGKGKTRARQSKGKRSR